MVMVSKSGLGQDLRLELGNLFILQPHCAEKVSLIAYCLHRHRNKFAEFNTLRRFSAARNSPM